MSTTARRARPRVDPGIAGIVAVAVISLAVLTAWSKSPWSGQLSHHGDASAGEPGVVVAMLWFSAAWLLMTIATMLPTALPLVTAFRRVTAGRRDARRLLAALIAGFLSMWLLAGLSLAGADRFVHRAAETDALRERTWVILAATLAAAGAYQLSPLAGRCLHACRSPFGFLGRHWSGGRRVRTQSWNIGIEYGVSCIGCCAALMAVMFAVGMANPLWMVLLGAVSGLHKLAPVGRLLAVATGWVLLVAAGAVVARHTVGAG